MEGRACPVCGWQRLQRIMLTELQCQIIEKSLTEQKEARRLGAYLCLHMGLMLSEVCALRRGDIDLSAGTLNISCIAVKDAGALRLLPVETPRCLPMPPQVRRLISRWEGLYPNGDCFIMTGTGQLPFFHMMQNLLNGLNRGRRIADTLSAMDLRNAFIRRCIQTGMDLYTLCYYVGIRQPNVILKRFGEYFSPRMDSVAMLEKFSLDSRVPAGAAQGSARMNLLILGAGSQGPVLREIAEALGVFSEIAFLDDDVNNPLAIGPLSDYKKLRYAFPAAIPSFGDSLLRREYFDRLLEAGYAIPRLIHPSATISKSNVHLGSGVVVEAKVIIANDVTVEDNVILSAGCVLDRECVIRADSHVGCACTVTRGSLVPEKLRVPAGRVYDSRQPEQAWK